MKNYNEIFTVAIIVMLAISVGTAIATYQTNGWIDWVTIKNINFGVFVNTTVYVSYLKWFKGSK